jgi:hypothetical protein
MKDSRQKAKYRSRFHDPLELQDTVVSTVGCRHSNPDICKNNALQGHCAFARKDNICLVPPSTWKKQFERLSRVGEKQQ